MEDRAYEELKVGNYDNARIISLELLHVAENYKDDWNYSNAIHNANTILGLVEIKRGSIDEACNYLKKSGEVAGSPQLNSCGPSTYLAMELLLADKKEEVVEYLELVKSFWEFGYKQLHTWLNDVNAGEIPESWQRLKYWDT